MHKLAFILLVIGGLNWGLTALVGGWSLANFVGSSIATIIYVLVGLSAIYEVFSHKGRCRHCMSQGM
ncbi:MAG: DUF378 domain-containing protein [Candidatus Zambryskibacteria bacterium]|nr:DUF378 domain-containing protein [Candidatus Zambryskibacteria bacterium]